MGKLVKIEKVEPSAEHERGSEHGFSARESKHFTVLHRKKGSVSGNHYHKGETKSKNPEIFYLVSGEFELLVKNLETGEEETHTIKENTKVEIPAGVFHKVTALTDITFLELSVDKEDFEGDTVRL